MNIREELVEMTQCKLHGVNSTLRIYLEGKSPRIKLKIIGNKGQQKALGHLNLNSKGGSPVILIGYKLSN